MHQQEISAGLFHNIFLPLQVSHELSGVYCSEVLAWKIRYPSRVHDGPDLRRSPRSRNSLERNALLRHLLTFESSSLRPQSTSIFAKLGGMRMPPAPYNRKC